MTTLTQFDTARFGQIEVEPHDVVTFDDGMVGLPGLRRFVLVQHKEDSPFRWLQSLDQGEVAFLVVDPGHYGIELMPEMPETTVHSLELTAETLILVYTICTIPNGAPREMTLNLAGPIVINAETRMARQVVLESESCPVKFRVFEDQAVQAA